MPRYYENVPTYDAQENVKNTDKKKVKYPKIIIALSFIFFAFAGGLEGFFQSQTYTYGICGPHSMTSDQVSVCIYQVYHTQ